MSRGTAARWLPALALVLFFAAPARAEIKPLYPLDTLVDEAHVILVAEPALPISPAIPGWGHRSERGSMCFRVLEVLKGTGVRPGERIDVHHFDDYRLDPLARHGSYERALLTVERVANALLFLVPLTPERGASRYRPVASGVRYLTRSGEILCGRQWNIPGPWVLCPEEGFSWEELLEWTRLDVSRIESFRALRRIDDAQERNAALLSWMEAHRNASDPGLQPGRRHLGIRDEPGGYGRAIEDGVRWVAESRAIEDAWKAISWWNRREPERWAVPGNDAPAFGSTEGRAFLLAVALDRARPGAERRCALSCLGRPSTLRPEAPPDRVPPEEKETLVSGLRSLTADEDVGEAASYTLATAQRAVDPWRPLPNLGALRAVYERPTWDDHGNTERRRAVSRLHERLNEAAWERLTGNPRGIHMDFRLCEPGAAGVQIYLMGDRMPLFEPPALVLERVDEEGAVLETRRMPIPFTRPPPDWSKGWTGWEGPVWARITPRSFTPGLWRVRFEGRAGGGGHAWRSENQGLRWPPR